MLTEHHPAFALPVRVAAVSVASVLLGVVAHGFVAGVLPRPDPLFVIAVLVLMLVGGLLAGGQRAGTWARSRGWSVPFEDVAGVLSLVAGQALVHWLVLPVGVPLAGAGSVLSIGHIHAAAPPADTVVSHHAAATTPAMLAVHAMAGVVVAVALRWVEAAILSLGQVLRLVHAPMASCLRALRACVQVGTVVSTGDHSGNRVCTWSSADVRPRLRVTLMPLGRRGPPSAAGWFQHVLAT